MSDLVRVSEVLAPGTWAAAAADHIELDYEGRHRRRTVLTGALGTRALLDLARSQVLADGAGLLLEDGRILQVIAKLEPLMEVRSTDAVSLLRLAWHIGNRHLVAQIEATRILLRHDPVIAVMLKGLGGEVSETKAGFHPESGAYAGQTHGDAPHAH